MPMYSTQREAFNVSDRKKRIAMKRMLCALFSIALLACAACAGPGRDPWQEQYDLGLRYLSEGNYEEAILAFSAAIEIDSRRAEAYVGRGDTYIKLSDDVTLEAEAVADWHALAEADYLLALECDDQLVDAYLKLAGLYFRAGDHEAALAVLERGYEATGDAGLLADQADGLLYFGARNERGEKEGYGVGIYDGSFVYKGIYEADVRSGQGTWEPLRQSETYYSFTGEWADDAPNGYGYCTWGGSVFTEGTYTNWMQNGTMWVSINRSSGCTLAHSYTAIMGQPQIVREEDGLRYYAICDHSDTLSGWIDAGDGQALRVANVSDLI